MYRVIEAFPERYDSDHPYAVGDVYPRKGWKPPKGRAEELADGTNRARKVYLEIVPDEEPKPKKKPAKTED